MRSPRPSAGTVLGGLALVVALGGTAFAATGQIVNLADGTTAANLAKVDASGALRTTQANLPLPARGFGLHLTFLPFSTFTGGLFATPATATVALDRVVVSDHYASPEAKLVRVYAYTEAAGTTACNFGDGGAADVRHLASYTLRAGETIVDTRQTPWVLKPVGGRPWCLMATYFTADGTTNASPELQLTGFVASGTPPSGTGFADAPPAADPTLPREGRG